MALSTRTPVHSPGELITLVYSHYQPASCWDGERLVGMISSSEEPPRIYCPGCKQHGTLRPIERRPTGERFRCASCKGEFKRALVLKRRGQVTATSSRNTTDQDWAIVDGMSAGKIMSIVETAPAPERAWALWVYAPQATVEHKRCLMDHLIDAMDSMPLPIRDLKHGTRVLQLIDAVLDDWQSTSRPPQSDASLSRLIGVNKSLFVAGRHWWRIKQAIEDACQQIDDEMLSKIPRSLPE